MTIIHHVPQSCALCELLLLSHASRNTSHRVAEDFHKVVLSATMITCKASIAVSLGQICQKKDKGEYSFMRSRMTYKCNHTGSHLGSEVEHELNGVRELIEDKWSSMHQLQELQGMAN